ncbi:hypothetical protein HNV12_22785 [Methanococcoides sp. SA1]|nr:hypothetical protein [Methanococcoides sp. SA1]
MELKKAFEHLSMSVGYIFHNRKNSGLSWTISKLYASIWLTLTCLALLIIVFSAIIFAIEVKNEPSLFSIFAFVSSIVSFVIFFGFILLILYLPIDYSYNHFVNLENVLLQEENILLQEENRLNDKKRKFLSTISESENYDLIVSFVSKYGLNYTKSDLENLNRLLQLKGMEQKLNTCDGIIDFDLKLDLDTTTELIYNEVQKQEISNYIKRIFQSKPSTKNDFLSIYLDMYGENLYELQKFRLCRNPLS